MKYIPNGTPRLEEIEILLNAGLFWLNANDDEDPDDPRDAKETSRECFVEAHELIVYMLEQQQKQNENNTNKDKT